MFKKIQPEEKFESTDIKNNDSFANCQAQTLIDLEEKYDVLLFVQIAATFFHLDLLKYMDLRSSYQGTGTNSEFMFMTAKLEEAAIYFDRWKDKTIAAQCRQLLTDLSAVQYIHIIK